MAAIINYQKTEWLKTKIYFFLPVLEARNQGVIRAMILLKVQEEIPFLASFKFWWLSHSLVCGCINPISATLFTGPSLLSESFPHLFLKRVLLIEFRVHPGRFHLKILSEIICKTLFTNKVILTGFRDEDVGISFGGSPFKLL